MQINSAYNHATQAINNGLYNLSQTAHAIAQSPSESDDNLLEHVVELKKQGLSIESNMQVIKTLNELEQHLIDVMA